MKHPCAHVVVTVRLGIASLSGFGFCISCARPLVSSPLRYFRGNPTGWYTATWAVPSVREALGVGAEGVLHCFPDQACRASIVGGRGCNGAPEMVHFESSVSRSRLGSAFWVFGSWLGTNRVGYSALLSQSSPLIERLLTGVESLLTGEIESGLFLSIKLDSLPSVLSPQNTSKYTITPFIFRHTCP
jgi:hypothetical protein